MGEWTNIVRVDPVADRRPFHLSKSFPGEGRLSSITTQREFTMGSCSPATVWRIRTARSRVVTPRTGTINASLMSGDVLACAGFVNA
jgi:hypothetical protein